MVGRSSTSVLRDASGGGVADLSQAARQTSALWCFTLRTARGG
jgi:hypothetical protein